MLCAVFDGIVFKAFELLRRMKRGLLSLCFPTPEHTQKAIPSTSEPPFEDHPAGVLHHAQCSLKRKAID